MNKFVFRGAVLVALAMTLASCTRKWWVSVVGVQNNVPVLCFSSRPNCRGDDVQFDLIDVTETDGHGDPIEQAWLIQGESADNRSYSVGRITYGVPPPGWVELRPEKPLKPGHFYSVNDEYFIEPMWGGEYRVHARKDFFERERVSEKPSSNEVSNAEAGSNLTQPARTEADLERLLAAARKRGGPLTPQEVATLVDAADHGVGSAYFALYLHHSMDGDRAKAEAWFKKGASRGEPNILAIIGAEKFSAAKSSENPEEKITLLNSARKNLESALENSKTLTVMTPQNIKKDLGDIDSYQRKISEKN